jgi:hypothetical protein
MMFVRIMQLRNIFKPRFNISLQEIRVLPFDIQAQIVPTYFANLRNVHLGDDKNIWLNSILVAFPFANNNLGLNLIMRKRSISAP